MKQFLIVLFFISSIYSYCQTIDGFCNFKFGTKQADILAISSIKDSIESQRGSKDEVDIAIRNIKFEDKQYDVCIFRFYKDQLYGGLLGKIYESEESIRQAVDSLKSTIKIEAESLRDNSNSEIDRLLFHDSRENELYLEAFKENLNGEDLYVLRLNYSSSKLMRERIKEKEKSRTTIHGGVEVIH